MRTQKENRLKRTPIPSEHRSGEGGRASRLTFMPRFVKNVRQFLQSSSQTLCATWGGGGGILTLTLTWAMLEDPTHCVCAG